eukprot:3885998-Rhodomonas_salina.2
MSRMLQAEAFPPACSPDAAFRLTTQLPTDDDTPTRTPPLTCDADALGRGAGVCWSCSVGVAARATRLRAVTDHSASVFCRLTTRVCGAGIACCRLTWSGRRRFVLSRTPCARLPSSPALPTGPSRWACVEGSGFRVLGFGFQGWGLGFRV